MTRFAEFVANMTRLDTLTGFDPEMFVVDKTDNKLIPAFAFLPPKTNPFILHPGHDDLEMYGRHWPDNPYTEPGVQPGLYWDGFQAEFSTRPHSCHGWAMDMIQLGLTALWKQARKFNPNAKLTLQNVFEFTPEELFQYPMEFVELGCDPSLNAYNRDPFRPENPFEVPVRMAGGHIHFAIKGGLEVEEAADIARYLDWLVGIPTVGMFEKFDNPKRREFYGRAGEFRLPPYGIEYRTLSNSWLGHPAISNLVCDMARYALSSKGFRKLISPEDFGLSFKDIQAVIDATDVEGARTIWNRTIDLFENIHKRKYYNVYFRHFDSAVRKGVQTIVPDFGDVEKNWQLEHGLFHHSAGKLSGTTSWNSYCNGVLK